MFRIAIDAGGTFTDGVLLRGDGTLGVAKVPTTPVDESEGIMECLKLLARNEKGMNLKDVLEKTESVTVGTTIGTKAVLQNKGAKVGMITTKGFRDVLEMRRIPKQEVYNLRLPKPVILIPRYLRIGVDERVKYTGEIITPLNVDEVGEAVAKFKAHKVEVIVVCFFHSYINPEHEKKAKEIIEKAYPNAKVVLSSSIWPQPMEFERFNTTTLSAYITPLYTTFLNELEADLKDAGFKGSLLHMTSNTGLNAAEIAKERPVLMLEAGPNASSLHASAMAKETGFEKIVLADIGGTSFGISVIPEGRLLMTTESIVADQRNACETLDIVNAGAGGGAIARLDRRGVLRLGPKGAGADPGPACYDKGGREATLTDACVVLGYVPSDNFMGGEVKLNVALARKAIKENIADPMSIDTVEAAYAVYSLAVVLMAAEIRIACAERGQNMEDFVLFAGGGAAPTLVLDIAKKLGINKVYIPQTSSVSNAYGMLYADFKHDLSRCILKLTKEVNLGELNNIYEQMKTELIAILKKEGVATGAIHIRRGANVRFYGQTWGADAWLPERPERVDEPINDSDFKTLVEEFHKRYTERYGRSDRGMITELVDIRIVATGLRSKPGMVEESLSDKKPSEALKRKESVYFSELGGFVEIPCYDGDKLQYGNVIEGPARVEETAMTVIIPTNSRITVDRYKNYHGQLELTVSGKEEK
jgi:N-methylhydantoinase A